MRVAITGGTGFVGRALTELLQQKGHEAIILSRSSSHSANNVTYINWLTNNSKPEVYLEGIDAIVNLAGESINNGRWTEKQKAKIYASRMEATDEVIRIIQVLKKKPEVLINASAIGIYPASNTEVYNEQSTQQGHDILAKTVADWEQKALTAEQLGVRVALGRFGIILDRKEGALPLMALPYKMFVGGPIGKGDNWMSWVHIQDVASSLFYAIENNIQGPFNIVAPDPRRMDEFSKTLAKVLNKPHYFPVPAFALRLVLGEKSQLVLEGQKVVPDVLIANGFSFKYPELTSALTNIYSQ